jgi:hypothetical protein
MLKINGVEIKVPSALKIQRFNLTKSGRVASGLMSMDLIAKKVKLEVNYEVLSGTEVRKIRDLIDGNDIFFDITFEEEDGTLKTITGYAGAIDMDKYRTPRQGGGWYWKNVSFALIER